MKEKLKNDSLKFSGIFVSAKILAMRNLSAIEKFIVADVLYFQESGCRISNQRWACKLGCSRRTIVNSINRLKSPQIGLLIDCGQDKQHRLLKVSSEMFAIIGKKDGQSRVSKIEKSRAEPGYKPDRRSLTAIPESTFGVTVEA
jgi:biotin operon repressor